MKVLVGLACVAVIAFIGYFFWGEWQAARKADEATQLAASIAEARRVDQTRDEAMSSDDVLDKLLAVDFAIYNKSSHPAVFRVLHEQTISGELQRLRISAAKEAARFRSCQSVRSVDYLRVAQPGFLEVRVICSPGLFVDYRSTGAVSELQML